MNDGNYLTRVNNAGWGWGVSLVKLAVVAYFMLLHYRIWQLSLECPSEPYAAPTLCHQKESTKQGRT